MTSTPNSELNVDDSVAQLLSPGQIPGPQGPLHKRRALKAIYIERAATDHLSSTIAMVRQDRRSLIEPACMLITGETGTGKSRFLTQYQGRPNGRKRRRNGCLIQPVLYVELLSHSTVISCAQALLRQLEDPAMTSPLAISPRPLRFSESGRKTS